MTRETATTLEHALLGLLALSPMTGYDILQIFTETPMMMFSSSPGSIYPALSRLEDRGWLRSETERDSDTRARRTYHVTPDGEEILDAWLARPPSLEEMSDGARETMLRFSVMEPRRSRGEVLAFLERFREVLGVYLEDLEARLADLEALDAIHPALALKCGVMGFRSQIEWVEQAIERIERAAAEDR